MPSTDIGSIDERSAAGAVAWPSEGETGDTGLDAPRSVGPWTLHEHLGSGGMGSVWRATDEMGRTAAVKLIRSDLRGDPEAHRRFRREFDTARRVTSRRVAIPLDANLDDGSSYIAWEYIEGETLQAVLDARGPLPPGDALTFARDVAEALRDLEAAGITHRDVKPNNILLSSASGAVLVDLGVALLEDQTGLTTGGQVIGTPGWLTPEQLEGSRPTSASDVFNWAGAVVFALTGRGPFGADTLPKLMYRVAHEPPDLTGVPAPLVGAVSAALAKDPSARPTARQLASQLNAQLDGVPALPEAPNGTVPLAVGEATRRFDTAAAPASDVATVFAAGEPDPPSRRWWLLAVPVAAAVAIGAVLVLTRQAMPLDSAASVQPPPAATTSPTVEPTSATSTPTDPPAATPPADPDDPASYYTADGTAPALTLDCPGVVGICLGNPIDRAVERLGTEDYRYDLEDEIAHTWDLGAITVSATADAVGSINELDVGTRDGARAATPIPGVTVGETTFDQFHAAVRGAHFADVLNGEGFSIVSVGIFSGSEGHLVQQVTTSLEFSDRDWDRVSEAGNDVNALLDIIGSRTIDGYQVGYEAPEGAFDSAQGDAAASTSTDMGEYGVPPQWVHDVLANARGGHQLVDGSTWQPDADINVVTGSMLGGATGRGMYAFFFSADDGYIGTDALEASNTLGITWRDDETIAIEYVLYRDGDPGCCPTGGSAVVRFHWDGNQLSALDEIPPTDGPVYR